MTHIGAILGTPAYMSPEQARGDTKEIGPASDIYSLGVILYELLTGKKPFTGSIGDILGKVQHVAPEPPSKLKSDIDPRLEKKCLKAMAKSPKERFGSMREFAFQLGEYLKDVPTGAIQQGTPDVKPATFAPSEATQMAEIIAAMSLERKAESKAVAQSQRKLGRLVLGVGGCLGLLMVLAVCSIGGVGGWIAWRGSDAPKENSNLVAVTLQNITHLHDNSVHYYLDGKPIDSKKLGAPLELSAGEHTLEGKRNGDVVETRSFRVGDSDHQKKIIAPISEPEREVGLIHEMKIKYQVRGLAVSPDGRFVLASGYTTALNGSHYNGVVWVWDIESGKKVDEHPLNCVERIAFGADGKIYFGIRGVSDDGPTCVMEYTRDDAGRWEDRQKLQGANGATASLERASGNRLLVGTIYGGSTELVVWNLNDTKTPIARLPGVATGCLVPDSDRYLIAKGTEVLLYEGSKTEKPAQTYRGHTSGVASVACSPDGQTIAAGTTAPANRVRVWNLATGEAGANFKSHRLGITHVQFTPDGRRLMSASAEGVRISDVFTGEEIYQTPDQGSIVAATLTPGGRRAVFGLADGTIRVWQLPK